MNRNWRGNGIVQFWSPWDRVPKRKLSDSSEWHSLNGGRSIEICATLSSWDELKPLFPPDKWKWIDYPWTGE